MTRALDTPWLGDRRGALADWLTQRWVQATGTRLDLREHAWLSGPIGDTRRIGADCFEALAARAGHPAPAPDPDGGLIPSFDALAGAGFDPRAVAAPVRDFYERTAHYGMDVWSQWHGLFRPGGGLLAALFSRRLQQLNIPLRPLDTAHGMSSTVVRLPPDPASGASVTGWIRGVRSSGDVVYVGAYSVVTVPGHAVPCVKVVFPLPNGNATVILRPSVETGGALRLESSGRALGDPGFYFLVRASGTTCWVRLVRTFRERIRVFVDPEGTLRTDHEFTIWRRTFLRLHYRLRRESG